MTNTWKTKGNETQMKHAHTVSNNQITVRRKPEKRYYIHRKLIDTTRLPGVFVDVDDNPTILFWQSVDIHDVGQVYK